MIFKINKVLIVGLGSIGKRYVKIINKKFPKIKIIVLRHKKCDDSYNKNLVIDRCFTSLEDAIQNNPQVAIIANPATKHVSVAKKIAKNGIHLMVEKPISENLDEAQELVTICKELNINLTIGYNLRFLPSLLYLKKCIDSGIAGKIYSIRLETGQYLPNWRPKSDYRKGVSAQKKLGGGILLELSHEIDYITWIFGSIQWVQSYTSRQSDLEIDVNDSASMILGIQNKDKSLIVASLNLDFVRHDSTRNCYIIGKDATLFWDGISGEVNIFSSTKGCWKKLHTFDTHRDYTYEQEINSFFNSVEKGTRNSVSIDDSLNVLKVIEATEKSSLSGTKVHL